MLFNESPNGQFSVKVGKTLTDAVKLMQVGFEFHCNMKGIKLFRK